MIEKIAIPNSDVAISRIGLGCARLRISDSHRNSSAIVEAALTLGVTHFDTAPTYANGESEKLLGSMLSGIPDVTITTKFGLNYPKTTGGRMRKVYRNIFRPALTLVPGLKSKTLRLISSLRREPENVVPDRMVIDRGAILRSIETSLERLKMTKIDLFLLHEPDRVVIDDQLLETLIDLKRNGVVGAYGGAWDRVVNEPNSLGVVKQCRVGSLVETNENSLVIMHGVLRNAPVLTDLRERTAAKERLVSVIRQNNVAVIFSASSARQVISALR